VQACTSPSCTSSRTRFSFSALDNTQLVRDLVNSPSVFIVELSWSSCTLSLEVLKEVVGSIGALMMWALLRRGSVCPWCHRVLCFARV
jgi:hypothetical protein